MRLIFLSLLFVAHGVCGDNWKTNGQVNGRFWNLDTHVEKTAYVSGYLDGMREMEMLVHTPQATEVFNHSVVAFTVKDIAQQIDLLYTDIANLNIPIRDMTRYAMVCLKGTYTKQELESRLIKLRQIYANAIIE